MFIFGSLNLMTLKVNNCCISR